MICKVIKLVTGETIMGSITEETKYYVDVYRPIKLYVVPKGEHAMSVMLAKWDHISDYDVATRVFKTGILSVGEPSLNCIETYNEWYTQCDDLPDEPEQDEDETENRIPEILKDVFERMANTNHTIH